MALLKPTRSATSQVVFFMTKKQLNLLTTLSTFQGLLENTFDNIPQDLFQTLDELRNFVKETKPKAV